MTTTADFSTQLGTSERIVAMATSECNGGQWLRLIIGTGVEVSLWLPSAARAKRLAAAINEAWPESALPFVPRESFSAADILNGDDPGEAA